MSLLGLPDIYTKTNYTLCIDLHMEFYYVWLCCYDNSEYWNCLLIMTTRPPPRPHRRAQERALLVKCVLYCLGATYFIFTSCYFYHLFFVYFMSNSWYNISSNISLACSVSTSSSHPLITGEFSVKTPLKVRRDQSVIVTKESQNRTGYWEALAQLEKESYWRK